MVRDLILTQVPVILGLTGADDVNSGVGSLVTSVQVLTGTGGCGFMLNNTLLVGCVFEASSSGNGGSTIACSSSFAGTPPPLNRGIMSSPFTLLQARPEHAFAHIHPQPPQVSMPVTQQGTFCQPVDSPIFRVHLVC